MTWPIDVTGEHFHGERLVVMEGVEDIQAGFHEATEEGPAWGWIYIDMWCKECSHGFRIRLKQRDMPFNPPELVREG